MTNLDEQIKLLIELQGLDTRIFKLEDELVAIPKKIKQMEDENKEKGGILKKHEDDVKALQLGRKEKEGELKTKEDIIKKYTAQMYQVKTNKEYSALQDEIGREKADNSLIEEEIIKILDQVDAANGQIGKDRELLKKEEVLLNEEKKKLEGETGRIKGELEKLKGQRVELAGRVDKVVLSKYERIIKSKDRLAVVPITGESCQGCFARMPPQVINEVKMKEAFVFCDSCARILYIED